MKAKTFILGAIVGALISALIHVAFFRHPFHHKGPPNARMMGEMLQEHFARELDLRPEQKAAVAQILQRLQMKMLEIRLSQSADMEKILSETDKELLPLLTPEQQGKLAEKREHMKKEHEEDLKFLKEHQKNAAQ